jgi:gliding motility-associated-like protein
MIIVIHQKMDAQIITTFAGNGTYGYSGDNGPATSAQFAWNYCIATDNKGNVYIGDHDNNVIRKVNSAGIITTIAGNHILGYSGDGGPAVAAKLYHPGVIAADNAGNIYFADQNSDVIRKIDPSGIISTIAGTLPQGYSGDGGPLALAQISSINGLTCDAAGNLYLSEYSNHVIRKVNASGIITTIAGNGTRGFSGDGGPATLAQLAGPYGVVIDNAGNLYIPDAANQRIRKVTPAGIISTFAGTGAMGYSGDNGAATSATFRFPWHTAIDPSGNLYVVDGLNYVVRKITPAGIITTFAGNGTPGYSGDGGPATAAQMFEPCGIASDNAGNIYVVNRVPVYVVRKITNCLTAVVTQQPAKVAICNTGDATFTVQSSNTNSYRWQANTGTRWNDLEDNPTYAGAATNVLTVRNTTSTMNNFSYRCALTNGCGDIFTETAVLSVTTPADPVVAIESSSAEICAGSPVLFTATIANGGSVPSFQWQKNGLPVGSDNTTYQDNTLVNGDIISCRLTSNATCLNTPTAVSNLIALTVKPMVTPSISITSSANDVCKGTGVTFNSQVINEGNNPQYTWLRNGVNQSVNSPTYTDNSLNDGDIITCMIRSNAGCVTSADVASNSVIMKIAPLLIPSITISPSVSSVCRNGQIIFTAQAVNGGNGPVYQWRKNNIPIGGNSNVYTANDFSNGDIVTCSLTSNNNCQVSSQASSNQVSVTVFPDPVIQLDQTTTLCDGATRSLDAGAFSSYQWNTGSTGRTITINITGTYSVTVTDSHGCTSSDAVNISTIIPAPVGFLPEDTSVCAYGSLDIKAKAGYNNYLWSNGSVSPTITISKPGQYWLQVTSNSNHCTGKDTITVSPKECLTGFYIPNAFTPNGDGKNELFRPIIGGNVKQYRFSIYDRWGQLVFQTSDLTKGWNGLFKNLVSANQVFVWQCSYQLEGAKTKIERGTVVVLK